MDEQCEKVLEVTLEENLQLIEESVAYLIENGKDVIVDAEHFYDGYNANPEYALKCLKTAANAGAKAIALCDTNGGMMPWDVEAITRIVVESLGDTMIGVHMHNDGGLAVANSIAGRSSWGDDGTRLFQRLRRTNRQRRLGRYCREFSIKNG